MKQRHIALGLATGAIAIAALAGAGYGVYSLGLKQGAAGTRVATAAANAALQAGDIDPSTGKKVLYWHDPMVPGQKFDKPGKSPFMDMMLVPVYADGAADQGQVSVSPRIEQNLGVRTAEVAEETLVTRVETTGSIAFNERDQAIVQARATGYVERLYVRATLDRVTKGQALVDLYVPDWVAAQEEFLAVRRMQGKDLAVLLDGARQRMRQAGMSEAQVRFVEASGTVHPRITLTAPIGGVVVDLSVREGMTVMPGASLFRINGLATVWANAAVPESQASLLRVGTAVQARSPALPGKVFNGRVQAILPQVDEATRTLTARIELANAADPAKQLAPGMFVRIDLSTPAKRGLTVPTEAIIQTGQRTLVMLADGGGKFRPVEVEIGAESNGRTEIRRGLQQGQKVVASGQFLLDSEASLRASTARMEDPSTGGGAVPEARATPAEHSGQARIEVIGKDGVTLSHQPIPSIGWGAMTMDFAAPPSGLPPGLKPGQSVSFAFTTNQDGLPVLTRIQPSGAPSKPGAPAAMEKTR